MAASHQSAIPDVTAETFFALVLKNSVVVPYRQQCFIYWRVVYKTKSAEFIWLVKYFIMHSEIAVWMVLCSKKGLLTV